MQSFTVSSKKRQEIIDINDKIKDIAKKSEVKEGICVIYTPHSTAAIIINENYDPNIMLDIIDVMSNIAPQGKWRHDAIDGNADAHIKSAIIGSSKTIIISKGELLLGETIKKPKKGGKIYRNLRMSMTN